MTTDNAESLPQPQDPAEHAERRGLAAPRWVGAAPLPGSKYRDRLSRARYLFPKHGAGIPVAKQRG